MYPKQFFKNLEPVSLMKLQRTTMTGRGLKTNSVLHVYNSLHLFCSMTLIIPIILIARIIPRVVNISNFYETCNSNRRSYCKITAPQSPRRNVPRCPLLIENIGTSVNVKVSMYVAMVHNLHN